MASEPVLSTGAINRIVNGPENAPDLGHAPILQCLMVRPIDFSQPGAADRYRVVLGDGITWMHSLLGLPMNHLVEDGKLVKGCICRVNTCAPMDVRGRTITIILDIEVLEDMGIHAKTGTPSEVVFTSPAHGKTIKFGLESPAYDLPYELPLSRFPQEMFDIIVSYLDQTDKLALLLTSKTLHARVRTSLYSSVKLRGKAGMKKFASTVAHSPIVCDYVRTCWLVGYVCCVDPEEPSIDFDLERLSMLREVRIQPAHAVTQRCSFMIPMLQKIVSGRMIQSLKSFHLDLHYVYDQDLPEGTPEQLFQIILSILSTPSLEHIAIFYRPRKVDEHYSTSHFDIQPHDPPLLPRSKFTDLQTLTLHWNTLPLPVLSALLQLPRTLQSLTLHLSLRYDHGWPNPEMPLDKVLSPVTTTIQTLNLLTVTNNNRSTPESMGLRISPNGLTRFTTLRHLSLPSSFLTPDHGFTGDTPWFPPSLTSLCLTDAQLYPCPTPDSPLKSTPAGGGGGGHLVTLDPETLAFLTLVSGMLDTLPTLSSFVIRSEGHRQLTGRSGFCAHPPPTVIVGESQRPLVDRGIRIGLEGCGVVGALLDVVVGPGV